MPEKLTVAQKREIILGRNRMKIEDTLSPKFWRNFARKQAIELSDALYYDHCVLTRKQLKALRSTFEKAFIDTAMKAIDINMHTNFEHSAAWQEQLEKARKGW